MGALTTAARGAALHGMGRYYRTSTTCNALACFSAQ